ncbi:hypothetical protein PPTG_24975 [Phytophthora nicotianae INRA-310]|uniref:Uncharacterized protein n=1 Tax=Phytophthora nicotianae (strain INRA-310) TaxID=761204 RepID=W2PBN6_PHYN3|nr:hypothetical protein PPTG_24975 [Phytophthora nicotianae INRA-310]ETM97394.1 hypothetical protein PPTG_24975 [Phytophthora nicotianae INRA-310]
MGTIFGFKGTQTSKTLKGQGLKEMFPFAREPLTITKDIDEGLRSFLTGFLGQDVEDVAVEKRRLLFRIERVN